jgi:tetratricopeptide (TPR) repeat protein
MLQFQDDEAQQVLEGLRVQLTPAEQSAISAPLTTSPDAYTLYLRGRASMNEYYVHSQLESLHEGRALAQQAISLDPKFAAAYALMAELYILEAANYDAHAAENLANGISSAEKASQLNPNLVEAVTAVGHAYGEAGRNVEAITYLRKAVQLAPNDDHVWMGLGYSYHYAGLLGAAERAYAKAEELNPTALQRFWMHARTLLESGNPEAAERELKALLKGHPDQYKALGYLGEVLYYQGRFDEAEAAFDRARLLGKTGGNTDSSADVLSSMLYAARGQRNKISPVVLNVAPEKVVDGDVAYWLAGTYALLGERDISIRLLRQTIKLGNHNYPYFERDRNFEKLHADPEYQRIMADVKAKWTSYKKQLDTE